MVNQTPFIVLDGAHSPASAEALCKTIHDVFRYERLIFVVGLMSDKDLPGIGHVICPLADTIITTQAFDNPRTIPGVNIAKSWSDFGTDLRICPTVSKAIQLAKTIATPPDLICITGSIILVGEAMQVLGIEIPET